MRTFYLCRSQCTQFGCGFLRTLTPIKNQYIYQISTSSAESPAEGGGRPAGQGTRAPRAAHPRQLLQPRQFPEGKLCTRAFYEVSSSSSSGPGLPPSRENTMTAPQKTPQVILSQLHCSQVSPASSPRSGVPPASSGRSLSLGPIPGVSLGEEGTLLKMGVRSQGLTHSLHCAHDSGASSRSLGSTTGPTNCTV